MEQVHRGRGDLDGVTRLRELQARILRESGDNKRGEQAIRGRDALPGIEPLSAADHGPITKDEEGESAGRWIP